MPTDLCPLPPVNQREAFEVVKCPQKQQTKHAAGFFPPLLPATSCLMEGDSTEAAGQGLGAPRLGPGPSVHLIGTLKSPHTRHEGEGALMKGENKPLPISPSGTACPISLWEAVMWLGETTIPLLGDVGLRWLERAGKSPWWLGRGEKGCPDPCWPWHAFYWHSLWVMEAAPLWGCSFLASFC